MNSDQATHWRRTRNLMWVTLAIWFVFAFLVHWFALRHHGTASAGARSRRTLGERFEAALARGERTAVDLVRRWRDRLDRRRTVGELRRMGRARLADLGIEPHDIERVVDGMLAARRNVAAAKGGVARPQSG